MTIKRIRIRTLIPPPWSLESALTPLTTLKTVPLRVVIPLLVFLLSLLLSGFMLTYETATRHKSLYSAALTDIRATLEHLQSLSETSLALGHYEAIEQEIGFLGGSPEVSNLSLIDPQGKILFSNRYALKQAAATQTLANFDTALFKQSIDLQAPLIHENDAHNMIFAYLPVQFPEHQGDIEIDRFGVLYLCYDLAQPSASIMSNILNDGPLLLLGVSSIMLLLLVALHVLLHKPLHAILAKIHGVMPGHIALAGHDELYLLSNAFEHLTGKLREHDRTLETHKNLSGILTETSQSIARIKDKQALCNEICQIAVKHGHFSLAWIGFFDNESRLVRICSHTGRAQQYLEQFLPFFNLPEHLSNVEPALKAMLRGNRVIVNDYADLLPGEPWRRAAQQSDIRACAAFPIFRFKQAIGVLAVYSPQRHFFHGDILQVLDEVAADLSFAMEVLYLDSLRRNAEQALKQREESLSVTLHSIGDAFITTDADGYITRMNPIAEQLTGWSFADAENRPLEQIFTIIIIGEHSRQPVESPIHKVLKQGITIKPADHSTLLSKSGRTYHIVESLAPIRDTRHNIIGAALVFHDISAQYAMTAALKESEERFRHVNEATGGYIWEINPQGYYTYVSDQSELVKGYTPKQLLGNCLYDLMSEDDASKIREAIANATPEQNKFHLIIRNITPSDEVFWEEMHCIVLWDRNGNIEKIRGAGVSINERIEADAEIKHMAYYDPLTDLPNRRMIVDSLKQAMASSRRRNTYGALLFFDIDRFKNLNDSMGHDAGDELLMAIAQRLKEHIREEDIAARLGGDEFIVLLSHLGNSWEEGANHARIITEKIQVALREPYHIKNIDYFSSSSIGITLFPQTDADAETLIKQADTALYRAKEAGRDKLQFFHPEMQTAANECLEIERLLHEAITEERLRIHYQPQYNSVGQLLGVEALLRCLDPNDIPLPMEKFLPTAEETGLIVEMGDWLLRNATQQFVQWKKSGILGDGKLLCINICPKQFKKQNFVEEIMEILSTNGFDSSHLLIEVTEKLFANDFAAVIEKLQKLRQLGIKVAIDNFGTGYSSLFRMKDLPLNQLKIDNTFIENFDTDTGSQTVIETIIAMGRYLSLNIIAEGVETREQLQFLKSKGCHNYQGYYFSPPLDAEAFEEFLAQRK